MEPKFTIGMAHHEDFEGIYFTIQSLCLYHGNMSDVELVVIDNSPNSSHSAMLKGLLSKKTVNGFGEVKYIPMVDVTGTSATRNMIFEQASGEHVLVMDCHVLLVPEALKRLRKFYKKDKALNLYSGPLLHDDMKGISTHFDDTWGAEMWGRWGSARKCECSRNGVEFSLIESEKYAKPIALEMGAIPITSCFSCKREIPQNVNWAGHEKIFDGNGFIQIGIKDGDDPFKIPGQGLGLFTCRKDGWLGFHPEARGFGGEEMYIHEKFRQAGHHAICLPFLKWVHRFGRPNPVTYVLTAWNKCRNYVLEFQELGLDLGPVHENFVVTGKISEDSWEKLVADPVGMIEEPGQKGCKGCGKGNGAYKKLATIEEIFDILTKSPRDLDQHMTTLRELASRVDHVTEFSGRRESAVAFLASNPDTFVSYNAEADGLLDRCYELTDEGWKISRSQLDSDAVQDIDETDLLFIDTKHTYSRLKSELEKFGLKSRRYIVMHDTFLHSERGEDGGPGLLTAIREFMRNHPEWSVIYHTNNQYGLTVLGCQKQDKPKLPRKWEMAKNLLASMKDIVLDGGKHVEDSQLEDRLMVCSICEYRNDTRCSVCGCFIGEKAKFQSQDCPIGKWPVFQGKVDI